MFQKGVCVETFVLDDLHELVNKESKEEISDGYSMGIFTDKHIAFGISQVEDTEIDIDSIEEINAEKIILSWNKDEKETFQENRRKINELIKAVKQLNKKIGD